MRVCVCVCKAKNHNRMVIYQLDTYMDTWKSIPIFLFHFFKINKHKSAHNTYQISNQVRAINTVARPASNPASFVKTPNK